MQGFKEDTKSLKKRARFKRNNIIKILIIFLFGILKHMPTRKESFLPARMVSWVDGLKFPCFEAYQSIKGFKKMLWRFI